MLAFDAAAADLDFVPKATPMFSDVISRLIADETLDQTRRRDLISGLRRMAKALGRAPEDVPCYPPWLQPRLARVSPAGNGLSTKAWQNVTSDARAAMVQAEIVERRQHGISDLAGDWQALWREVLASRSPTLQPSLCRFVHFLNRRDVRPAQVGVEHAQAYREALIRNEIGKAPEVSYRAAVNGWNLAVKQIGAWPRITLPLESRQKRITLSERNLPKTLLEEIDALMHRLGQPDPFASHGRLRALRPDTVKQYRHRLLRFASELLHSGVAATEIKTLGSILDPTMVERGLRQMLTRTDGNITSAISEMATLLRGIGRDTEQPAEKQDKLAEFAKKLALPPRRGMTRKNRDRLRVLQDDKHLQRLLWLPERLFANPPKGTANAFTKALAREDAIAIALLLFCPIRAKNLAGIHLEHNLQRPGDGRVFLVLTGSETKNERPLEFELPRDLIRMIDGHLTTRCPQLCPPGTPWLFPRRDGAGPIPASQIAHRIGKRVRREIGIDMNAHLFRHFAVMTWLNAHPGSYEAARRLLGHSEISHTINLYSGLEVTAATRAFSDLVNAHKEGRR
ncbi:site-specific integrase [Paracoccus suum]|uniref:Site-specific integrase n=1 Tax=Paracoccus suum TaxID=2259340 RepID=A0A344PHW9_9RHOB|nr:site-specific integrase [Paracoccus suum]AXC48974.1 site-specific integrase [Paracoccus suum]